MPGFKARGHALASEPREAGLQPSKIVVGNPVGARFRVRVPVPAIGRSERREMVDGARNRGVSRISRWGNHARMLPVAPYRFPL